MKFTSESTLSEVLNNPVGYDVAQKVVYRKNIDVDILSDENFCKKTLGELLTDKVTDEAMKYLLDMYINKFPHINIEYVKMITASSISSIASGESDVAFICEQSEPINPAIKVSHLCTVPLYLVAAPSLPAVKHGIKKSKILNSKVT